MFGCAIAAGVVRVARAHPSTIVREVEADHRRPDLVAVFGPVVDVQRVGEKLQARYAARGRRKTLLELHQARQSLPSSAIYVQFLGSPRY
jgi:hypothetical protein